jgi:hypothetical protein
MADSRQNNEGYSNFKDNVRTSATNSAAMFDTRHGTEDLKAKLERFKNEREQSQKALSQARFSKD